MAGPVLQMNARERRLAHDPRLRGRRRAASRAFPSASRRCVRSAQSDNDDLRQALSDVQDARGRVRERQAKKDAIAARYAKKAPPLAGYLEQTARAAEARGDRLDAAARRPARQAVHRARDRHPPQEDRDARRWRCSSRRSRRAATPSPSPGSTSASAAARTTRTTSRSASRRTTATKPPPPARAPAGSAKP